MKEQIIERADELAEEVYDKEFYDLTDKQQDEIFLRAESEVVEGYFEEAEGLGER